MADTQVSAAGFLRAVKELSREWEQTKAHWNDSKSREFEEAFLEELPQQVAQTALVIEEINVLLKKIRNDCE